MRITKIETIWFEAQPQADWAKQNATARQALPNNLWVRVHTDTGLSGLGETYYLPRAVAAIIHDVFAPLLIGRDPRDIENHWQNMFALINFCGVMGAEMRAISALDVALWDLLGQIAGLPIYIMLGGRSRDRIRVYNTCVGFGKYPDLDAWLGRQGRRARRGPARPGHHRDEDLAVRPVRAGHRRTRERARPDHGLGRGRPPPARSATASPTTTSNAGIAIVEDIRNAVGDRMQIAIEGHAAGTCRRRSSIARALEPYDIMWLEEIMPPDNVDAFVRLKAETCDADLPERARLHPLRLPPLDREGRLPTSSCPTSPGAAASPRAARSPRWPTPPSCRSPATTPSARSRSGPPPT